MCVRCAQIVRMVRAGQAFMAKGEPKPHSFSHLRAQNITLNFRLFWPSVLILKLFRGVNLLRWAGTINETMILSVGIRCGTKVACWQLSCLVEGSLESRMCHQTPSQQLLSWDTQLSAFQNILSCWDVRYQLRKKLIDFTCPKFSPVNSKWVMTKQLSHSEQSHTTHAESTLSSHTWHILRVLCTLTWDSWKHLLQFYQPLLVATCRWLF